MFAAGSPIQYVEKINVPVLIMHGERDPQLAFASNALPLFEAFQRRGVDVRLKRYPTYGHSLTPPGNNGALGPMEEDALADLQSWTAAHVR
jgi:dipeptidyl aminopeptidase/acylaminoacyl peptidase